jgi:hypothetical protein
VVGRVPPFHKIVADGPLVSFLNVVHSYWSLMKPNARLQPPDGCKP